VRLDEADLLYLVVGKFADIDLHPDAVGSLQMGYVFEELIRRFSEQSNETAGEHFTPREVIRLMVDLLFAGDSNELRTEGIVKTLYDPACGTGGMLSIAEDYLRELHPDGQLEAFGQELNAESYAICRSDMMLKGQDARNIAFGNTLSNDQHDRQFDYMLSNPPFGVEWKKIEAAVKEERDTLGHASRFGAGLPRINDGSFLFLQHMISKMKPAEEGGSRIAIVFDGSPLFTGRRGRASRRSVAGSSRTTGLTLSSRWAGHVLFRGAGWRALAGLRPGQVECEGDGAELDDEPLVSRDGLEVVGTVERFGALIDRVDDDDPAAGAACGGDDRGERVDEQLAAEPVALQALV